MRLFLIILALIVGGIIFILMISYDESSTILGMSNEQFANFSYLTIIGLCAASVVLGSSLKIGIILRHGLIWCGLIFALLFGYQYRYQLQDFSHQLTMGLVPASPFSHYDDENRLNVTLRRSNNGYFEARALVNDRASVHFLLDTGASSIVLSHADALNIGIDVAALTYSITTYTANGEARAAPIRLQSLKIGEIERNNIRALVARPQALSDSLLGMNFLNSLSGYNVRGDQITLID